MTLIKYRETGIVAGILVFLGLMFFRCTSPEPQWPQITRENKPWTRWWWMGSSVQKEDLSRRMEQYAEAGLGGVEITPIYGVAGYEEQFIDYLSPRWMEMLGHTLREGQRLDLGVDMATGTGWPFGGPWVQGEHASRRLYYKTYRLPGGESLDEPIRYTQEPYVRAAGNHIYELHGFLKAEGEDPKGTAEDPLQKPGGESLTIKDIRQPVSANENLQALALEQVRFEEALPLQALMAYSNEGDILNLTERVGSNGKLVWTAPAGNWTLYAVFLGWHGKMVERAAPGGEGLVIDHFSEPALRQYLATFDSAFAGHDLGGLRSFFNDSYEVDDAEGQADWTPGLFDEFEKRRGYDLREYLPALLDTAETARQARVITDYRETISDLLLEKFTRGWDRWAEEKGAMIRNQAHGSPANILDLYAASDIPETEGTDILRAKMASSAAHMTGKQLVSAEAATWLNEHFLSSLADVKTAVDRYFISGVNHIFYHGTAYSPLKEEWPGWLFYAAVHFNERNPFWDHFAAFNRYVARVQSFLQAGDPDNDVLLYFPIYDRWAEPVPAAGGMLRHFDGGLDEGFEGSAFKQGAELMADEGYGFDFISDRQLQQVVQEEDGLQTAGVSYKTIVVPNSRFIPLSTFKKLMNLAKAGATIIGYQGLPEDVPGLGNLNTRQSQFRKLADQLKFSKSEKGGIQEAKVGKGRLVRGDNLDQLLEYAGIKRELMLGEGLQYVRRKHDTGYTYFILNRGEEPFDGWISVARPAASVAIFDPMQGRAGFAKVRNSSEGAPELHLQLEPGESCIVKAYKSGNSKSSFRYVEPAGDPWPLQGTWTLEFTEGGPELPADIQMDTLGSWTGFEGEAVRNFSGTGKYSITFARPAFKSEGWLLDLGEVCESAVINVNGRNLGTLVGPLYRLYIDDKILQDSNTLEVEVANLMANRIAWLDRRQVNWKKFYNVNFPAQRSENRNGQGLFDASDWDPLPSGLIGPVKLIPVRKTQ